MDRCLDADDCYTGFLLLALVVLDLGIMAFVFLFARIIAVALTNMPFSYICSVLH